MLGIQDVEDAARWERQAFDVIHRSQSASVFVLVPILDGITLSR